MYSFEQGSWVTFISKNLAFASAVESVKSNFSWVVSLAPVPMSIYTEIIVKNSWIFAYFRKHCNFFHTNDSFLALTPTLNPVQVLGVPAGKVMSLPSAPSPQTVSGQTLRKNLVLKLMHKNDPEYSTLH